MFSKSLRDFFKNPILAVPSILFSLGMLLFALPFSNSFLKLYGSVQYSELAGPEYILGQIGKLMLFMLLFFLIILIISPIISAWGLLMTRNVVNLKKADFVGSFKESFKYYWRALGCIVLIGLIFFAAYIIFVILLTLLIIPIALAGNVYSPTYLDPKLIIIIIILAIPMAFLAICVLPIIPLLVYDNLSLTEAFGAGFKLGFKKFFRILGACIFVAIIAVPISFITRNSSQIVSIIFNIITTYLNTFIYVYIINLYAEYKEYQKPSLNYQQPQEVTNSQNNLYNSTSLNEDEQLSFYNEKEKPEDDSNNKFRV